MSTKAPKAPKKRHQWMTYNQALKKMPEHVVHKALLAEVKTHNRRSYVLRLFARYNALRRQRELEELLHKHQAKG